MADFLLVLKNIAYDFINGVNEFWSWFIKPIIEIGDLTIAPYMILSFGAIVAVFGLCLVHLINPLG